MTATTTVPPTYLDDKSQAIIANTLKPIECAALNLTSVVICPGGGSDCTATDASELILGSPYGETIDGLRGADCILGGGGDDFLKAGPGVDVCIGGPGNDKFSNCETQIQ